MTLIVLHVGMPKTATTTIQYSLEAHSGKLLRGGVLLPKSGRSDDGSPCHHALFLPAATSVQAVRTPLQEPTDSFEGMAAKVENERREAGATSVILSSEMLWNPFAFDRSALSRIRTAFHSYNFVVLAFLRPVESHILSSYAQRVTGLQRYGRSFDDHASELFAEGTYNYVERLNDFRDVFGKRSLKPIWLPWQARDVLRPFRDIFPELGDITAVEDLNRRRTWLYVSLVRRLNALEATRKNRNYRFSRRGLGRLDALARRFPALDEAFSPMDKSSTRRLERRTEEILRQLNAEFCLQ